MSAWKVHLVWGVLAVVAAAAWGQHVSSRKEREFESQRAALRRLRTVAPVATPSAGHAEPLAPSSESPEARETPGGEPAGAPPAAPSKLQPLTAEQIGELLRNGNSKDGERAVKAIEKLQDRTTKLALLREALGHAEEDVRRRALDQLRKLGGPEAAELLAKALLSDPEQDLRERAARILGDVGGPVAMSALQEAARSGSLDLQVASAVSLNKLGDAGPTRALLPQLGRMLESQDGAVREDVVGYLDDLRTSEAIPLLGQALRDPNSDIRRDAIEALEDLGSPDVIPLLQQAVSDPHPAVARDAQRALEKIQTPKPKKP